MFCNNCGAELKENARFCPKCGVEIKQEDTVEASKEETPPEKVEEPMSVLKKRHHGVIWGVIIVVVLFLVAVIVLLKVKGLGSVSGKDMMKILDVEKFRPELELGDGIHYCTLKDVKVDVEKTTGDSDRAKVQCILYMYDDSVEADVEYEFVLKKKEGKWAISKFQIKSIEDVRPLMASGHDGNEIKELIRKEYSDIEWGMEENGEYSESDIEILINIQKSETDLQAKTDKCKYRYEIVTDTEYYAGKIDLEYCFTMDGIWELNKVSFSEKEMELLDPSVKEPQKPEEQQKPEEVVGTVDSDWNGLIDKQNLIADADKSIVLNEISTLKEAYGYDIFVIADPAAGTVNKEEYIANIYEQNGSLQPKDNKAICLFIDSETTKAEVTTFGTDISGFDTYVVNNIKNIINTEYDGAEDVYAVRIRKFLTLCNEQLGTAGKIVSNWGITTAGTVDLMNCNNLAIFFVDAEETARLYKGSRATGTIIMSMPKDGTGANKAVFIDGNTFLNINDKYSKYNSTYAKDGALLALDVLNRNLDMGITDFISLGKCELVDIMNYFGGMDVVVDTLDRTMMYGYGEEAEQHAVGLQHLDGEQLAAYCYGTYSVISDRRNQNQVEVLNYISGKLQDMSASEYSAAMEYIYGKIYTSLEVEEVKKVLTQYVGTENALFPYPDMRVQGVMGANGNVICSNDLVAGVKRLHYELFGVDDYTPSDTVKEISVEIDAKIEEYALRE